MTYYEKHQFFYDVAHSIESLPSVNFFEKELIDEQAEIIRVLTSHDLLPEINISPRRDSYPVFSFDSFHTASHILRKSLKRNKRNSIYEGCPYDRSNKLVKIQTANVLIIDMSKANSAYMRDNDRVEFFDDILNHSRDKEVILLYDLREIGGYSTLLITNSSYLHDELFEFLPSPYDLCRIRGSIFCKNTIKTVGTIVRDRYSHIFRELTLRGDQVTNNPAGEFINVNNEEINLFVRYSRMKEIYSNFQMSPLNEDRKPTIKQFIYIAIIITLLVISILVTWMTYKKW